MNESDNPNIDPADRPSLIATKDPAEGSVLVRCPACGEDAGPVWPDPTYPLVPLVQCLPDGGHEFVWHEGRTYRG